MKRHTRLIVLIVGLLFMGIGINFAIFCLVLDETPEEDKTDWPLYVDITMWSGVFSLMFTMVFGVGMIVIAVDDWRQSCK